jgi:hypothetical protein
MPSTPRAALLALAAALAPGDAALKGEVLLSIEAPQAYLRRFRRRLADREIEPGDPELPWVALLDGLEARTRLWFIDHRTFPDGVMHAVARLAPAKGRFAWAEAIEAIDTIGTTDFLRRTARRMRSAEARTLVSLESPLETDTFPVAVVRVARAASLRAWVAIAGHTAVDFSRWRPPPAPVRKARTAGAVGKPRQRRMYWRRFAAGSGEVSLWIYPLGFDVHGEGSAQTHLFESKREAGPATEAFMEGLRRRGYREVSTANAQVTARRARRPEPAPPGSD